MIPFLFFAFAGTTTLTYIGLTSQQRLIKAEEKKQLLHYYRLFLHELGQKKNQAISLGIMIAENHEVQKLLAERNRQGLNDLLLHTFIRMKEEFNVAQFHFHIPPATSFLRLHFPERYGEDMRSYRKTVLDAVENGIAAAGLEMGVTGFGIRGVVPIFYNKEIVGTVEIGLSFDEAFLKELHKSWGIDFAIYEIIDKGSYRAMAKVSKRIKEFIASPYMVSEIPEEPATLIAPDMYPDISVLLGPVEDYSGKKVVLVEIVVDRSEIQERLTQTRALMVFMGIAGIAISFLLTYLVAYFFIKPIKKIVGEAQDIAEEKREIRLEPGPRDEIGDLTQTLNIMLDALKMRRMEIEDHAKNLERRVQERTADLVASMENYRTLVENVPLIVYRVLENGTTEFINSYLTDSLGYEIEEAVGNKNFWREIICGNNLNAFRDLVETCFKDGVECRIERSVRHRNGRLLTFIDHAIPATNENGRVRWIDGIMMDISELKRLQERALRTEEIKTLGEISARMAHEIRNPLVSAGGFARRLRDSLPEHDPHHKLAQIIVGEVARLETFLKALLTSIRPFEISLAQVDMNKLLRSWIVKLNEFLKSKGIEVVEDLQIDVPEIQGDHERLSQAFESILKHAIVSMPEGDRLFISTRKVDDQIVVTFRHNVPHLSDDDLEQFFYPHLEEKEEWTILELPLSKIIIHRHGGKVVVFRKKDNVLEMKIEFPINLRYENSE